MTLPVASTGPASGPSHLPTPAATLHPAFLNGVHPVYLTDAALAHTHDIAAVIAILDRTSIGMSLLQDMDRMFNAGGFSTVEWQYRSDKAWTPGTWFYQKQDQQDDHGLSPETKVRHDAARIFPDLVNARNALVETLRWRDKPLQLHDLQKALNRELGLLRQNDAATDTFDNLLTAHVASNLQLARSSVLRQLHAINSIPEGAILLQQLATLRDLGVMPIIDTDTHGMGRRLEPDGIPIWNPTAEGNNAIMLETLANVRDALSKLAIAQHKRNAAPIAKMLDLGKVQRDSMEDILPMNLVPIAMVVRGDVVYDLREIQRTDIGRWLIEQLRQHAKAGYLITLVNGPVSGAYSDHGKHTWAYSKTLLEARASDDTGMTSSQARLCVAFADLMTLVNGIGKKRSSSYVSLPESSMSKIFQHELLKLQIRPAPRAIDTLASVPSHLVSRAATNVKQNTSVEFTAQVPANKPPRPPVPFKPKGLAPRPPITTAPSAGPPSSGSSFGYPVPANGPPTNSSQIERSTGAAAPTHTGDKSSTRTKVRDFFRRLGSLRNPQFTPPPRPDSNSSTEPRRASSHDAAGSGSQPQDPLRTDKPMTPVAPVQTEFARKSRFSKWAQGKSGSTGQGQEPVKLPGMGDKPPVVRRGTTK